MRRSSWQRWRQALPTRIAGLGLVAEAAGSGGPRLGRLTPPRQGDAPGLAAWPRGSARRLHCLASGNAWQRSCWCGEEKTLPMPHRPAGLCERACSHRDGRSIRCRTLRCCHGGPACAAAMGRLLAFSLRSTPDFAHCLLKASPVARAGRARGGGMPPQRTAARRRPS